MEKATEFSLIFVNCESYENATQIARILVTEKLAACCSLLTNVKSFFGWQGAIHERHEITMMIKTSEEKSDAVETRIKELHADDVPEIISLKFDTCSKPYYDWMKQVLPVE